MIRNFTNHPSPALISFDSRRVLVVGLGRFGGGVGVTRWLAEQGARVIVTDQADEQALASSIQALEGLDVEFKLNGHDPDDLRKADAVIVNPAVDKARSDFFRSIVDSGVWWTTEMNLFCPRCPAPVIGVTGSFGKSTTAAMIAAVLNAAVEENASAFTGIYLGGNIGRSLLSDLEAMRDTDAVVLEMSNAQLEDLPRIGWAPAVAVITNIVPHHLDRHGSFDEYVAAKLNILAPDRATNLAASHAAAASRIGRPSTIDARQTVFAGDLHADAEAAFARSVTESSHQVVRVRADGIPQIDLRVPGAHNRINAAMACEVTRRLGVPEPIIRSALANFPGLPHRLEYVATVDGVEYTNDSKSTSPAATMVAVEALAGRSIVAIVGGKRKDGVTYDACGRLLAARCKAVICAGECGPEFAAAIRPARPDGACHVCLAPSLDVALASARAIAQRGDTVLLSPGAASFDAYVNYTERGDHFARLVTSPSELSVPR